MSERIENVPEFLQTRIAPRFREAVTDAEQRLQQVQRDLDEVRGAQGTVGWEIGNGPLKCYLNIADGEMTVAEKAADQPFMTVTMSAEDWARFVVVGAREGLYASGSRRPFGRSRIERLRAIKGALRVALTGLPDGSTLTTTLYFAGERPREPQATVQVAADVVMKIQSGQLNPQAAFMQGQMKLIGDMGFAMQLGMALML